MTEDTLSDLEIPRPQEQQQQQQQDQDLVLQKKVPSIECLNSDMPGRCHHHHRKDRGKRMLKTFINRLRLRKCASANISEPDPLFKVAYLGNVVTGWAKGDGCVEKPLATLWRNYTQSSRPDVRMQLLVSGGGLKATTKDHGLTEYWAHRLTTCAAPPHFPRLFCWVYRHEGRRLRHELRCHAVLCQSASIAREIEARLKESLVLALAEFRKEKMSRQNARLSLANSVYENPSIPRRKILLSTGACNYRPPLERSKSAPKLSMIEENLEEEMDCEIFEGRPRNKLLLRSSVTEISLDLQKKIEIETSNRRFSTIIELDDEEERELRLKFGDQLSIDVQSELILQELAHESLMLDTCEMNTWLRNLENANISDDGSLSSGCESASTGTSDLEQGSASQSTESSRDEPSATHTEPQITITNITEPIKTELDFKIGESVLSRVRSFERISNDNIRKFCGMKSCLLNSNNNNNNNNISHNILDCDEVSLIPVGESHADFSSLKVFKKRCLSEADKEVITFKLDETEDCDASEEDDEEEEESGSACSDESGYDEVIDCITSIANIVLV